MSSLLLLSARKVPTLDGDLPQSPSMLLRNLLVGVLFDSLLMGVFTVQCVTYWRDWPRHDRVIRWTVLVIFLFNLLQTSTNQLGIVEIMRRQENYAWLKWAGTASVVMVGHLAGPFLMFIPHILLTRKCLAFARSLEVWKPLYRRIFGAVLWFGITVCFCTGTAAVVALWVQARNWTTSSIGIIDWYAIFLTVNLATSAFCDLLLTLTLTWELRRSNTGIFSGTSKILDGLTQTLLTNGFGLAALQIVLCCVYLSGINYSLASVGLIILGKMYSVTALLSITRPLEIQRSLDMGPARTLEPVNLCSLEYDTSSQDTTLAERIVSYVRHRGRDPSPGSPERACEEGDRASSEKSSPKKRTLSMSASASSQPLTGQVALPTLAKHASSPSPSRPSLARQASSSSNPRPDHYGLDMQFILSEMEPSDGVVALPRLDRAREER